MSQKSKVRNKDSKDTAKENIEKPIDNEDPAKSVEAVEARGSDERTGSNSVVL
jgi:hypothetical protein